VFHTHRHQRDLRQLSCPFQGGHAGDAGLVAQDRQAGVDDGRLGAGAPDHTSRQRLTVVAEGEERTVTVPPEEGYGPHRPELEREVPVDALPENVKVGDQLQAQTSDGVIQVWVKEIEAEMAVVDGNHPLAGKTIEFDLKLVAIGASEAD